MLRFLGVRHLAVIDQLDVEFDSGLNILTGETGAGKSVLIAAIDLLVGGRASADLVRTGEALATVQAVFERPGGDEVIVRREVSAQGRSRAFIDDALATGAAMKDLGSTLVDLHGQHEHQALLDPAEHVGLLDAFLTAPDQINNVASAFDDWRAATTALDRTRLDDREKRARIDMASFQLQEIGKVAPTDGEDATLAADRTVLANADRLSRLSTEAYAALYEGDGAALAVLAGIWKRIAELASIDSRFAPYLEERNSLKSGLEDLAFFLRDYAADIDSSPDRLQAVEDRLAAIDRLKRKYGPDLSDVLARQAALHDELAALGATEERVAALEADERAARDRFLLRARALSRLRHEAALRLGTALVSTLVDLAMPHARLEVVVTPTERPDDWTRQGIDAVEFLFSANPGEDLRPLARIASGGELSRVMLALRTLAAPDGPGRTLIFDEVDAGIGGAAADAVGARLQALARRYQVICITHLPQIAARAGTHFQITKQVTGGRTTTSLARLDESGRELEIARMIAGAQVTAQVRASAREMLELRHESEIKAKAKAGNRTVAKAKGRRNGA